MLHSPSSNIGGMIALILAASIMITASNAGASPLPGVVMRNQATVMIGIAQVHEDTNLFIAGANDIFDGQSALAVAATVQAPLVQNNAIISVTRTHDYVSAGAGAYQSFWMEILSATNGMIVPVIFSYSFAWFTDQPVEIAAVGHADLMVGYSADPANQIFKFVRPFCSGGYECASTNGNEIDVLDMYTNILYLVQTNVAVGTFSVGPTQNSANIGSQLSINLMYPIDANKYSLVFSPGIAATAPEANTLSLFISGLITILLLPRFGRRAMIWTPPTYRLKVPTRKA